MPFAEERFWKKVVKSQGCWLWSGAKDSCGYGVVVLDGRTRAEGRTGPFSGKAHRVMFQLVNGPIPKGMLVCHHCDNPTCVRPDHLFLGTNQDNQNDRYNKGRYGAILKLSEAEVILIRNLSLTHTQRELASRFGVNQSTISRIVNQERRARVTTPPREDL